MREMIMLVVFCAMMALYGFKFIRTLRAGGELLGKPAINRLLYAGGKLSVIASWAAIAAISIGWNLSLYGVPEAFKWAGFVLFLAGALFCMASASTLDSSLRFGLSETIEFKSGGIYRLSRNPMYVGFVFTGAAVFLYTLNPVFLAMVCFMVYAHHLIIRAEEDFMRGKFGRTYVDYLSETRRYL